MAKPDQLTSADFDEKVLKSDKPYLVDFWAAWCGPCRTLGPIIEEIAEENDGRFGVGKVDVEANQDLASKYHVLSIPTMILFKGGEPVATMVGAAPKASIMSQIEEHL